MLNKSTPTYVCLVYFNGGLCCFEISFIPNCKTDTSRWAVYFNSKNQQFLKRLFDNTFGIVKSYSSPKCAVCWEYTRLDTFSYKLMLLQKLKYFIRTSNECYIWMPWPGIYIKHINSNNNICSNWLLWLAKVFRRTLHFTL